MRPQLEDEWRWTSLSVRTLRQGEEQELLRILAEAHGNFYDPQATKLLVTSQRFDPNGTFIAEKNGSPLGCVAVTRLPRRERVVIRYLAVRDALSRIPMVNRLLDRAIQYAKSQRVEFVRATTPAIEPYVTAYKKNGFKPVRSDFRISWDLTTQPDRSRYDIIELPSELVESAAKTYVLSLDPYWDWRTDELGGKDAVAASFIDGVRSGVKWLVCSIDNRIVGLAGLRTDYYEPGAARFQGAYVVPDFRGKGIGKALMNSVKRFAREMNQHRMVVYTFSYLDCLTPGALLYLKSGGKIEAEYVQLQPP